MRRVNKVAMVDEQRCTACATCVRICPVEAIVIEKHEEKGSAAIDEQRCRDCSLCVLRCPEDAVKMIERESVLQIGVNPVDVSQRDMSRICRDAHMYPDQVICYCHRVQAKEVAAAILLGARSPEDIARATGARTGCGTLCITSVLRLLRAAGIKLTQAPGYQWYGVDISIWNLPEALQDKYKQFYIAEDLQCINELFPGSKQNP